MFEGCPGAVLHDVTASAHRAHKCRRVTHLFGEFLFFEALHEFLRWAMRSSRISPESDLPVEVAYFLAEAARAGGSEIPVTRARLDGGTIGLGTPTFLIIPVMSLQLKSKRPAYS